MGRWMRWNGKFLTLLVAMVLPALVCCALLARNWFVLYDMPEVGDSSERAYLKVGPPTRSFGAGKSSGSLPATTYHSSELGLSRASALPGDFEERWLTWVGPLWTCPTVVDFKEGAIVRVYVGKP